MPSQQQVETTALVAAQGRNRAILTAQAIALATASARAFHGWYDHEQITDWAGGLAVAIEALQKALASSTDAYLARMSATVTGRHVRPSGAIDVSALRTGVTHAGSYARAADVFRYNQSIFDSLAKSIVIADIDVGSLVLDVDPTAAASLRVAAVADMDAQLAVRDQSRYSLTQQAKGTGNRPTGWRRVIHPELALKSGASCGLCIVASDRVYKVADLMPLHADCHCEVVPVYANADPGSIINADDLRTLYANAGSSHANALKNTRYQIDEHGELGPVLNRAGAPFRTHTQAVRDTGTATTPKTPAQIRAGLQRLRDGQAAALPRVTELVATDARKWSAYLASLRKRIADLDDQLAA